MYLFCSKSLGRGPANESSDIGERDLCLRRFIGLRLDGRGEGGVGAGEGIAFFVTEARYEDSGIAGANIATLLVPLSLPATTESFFSLCSATNCCPSIKDCPIRARRAGDSGVRILRPGGWKDSLDDGSTNDAPLPLSPLCVCVTPKPCKRYCGMGARGLAFAR